MSPQQDDGTLQMLAGVPYLAGLTTAELEALSSRCRTRSLAAGESILLEGEPAAGLCVVQTGKVRVYKSSPDGREQVLLVMSAGETFNDVPVFDRGTNPASVDALVDGTIICVIPAPVIAQLLATNALVAANVAAVLAARLRRLTLLVEDLSLRQIVQRLARLLLEESKNGAGTVQLTHQDMATRVGTAREVISRAMRELERRGAISRTDARAISVDASLLEAVLYQVL